MTNVIYIEKENWNTMLDLKRALKYYEGQNNPKYHKVISKFSKIYSEELSKLKVA